MLRECRCAEQWPSSLLNESCAQRRSTKSGNSASAFDQRLARTRDWARINVPTNIWTVIARARAGSCACKWSFGAENSSLFCGLIEIRLPLRGPGCEVFATPSHYFGPVTVWGLFSVPMSPSYNMGRPHGHRNTAVDFARCVRGGICSQSAGFRAENPPFRVKPRGLHSDFP
jgi:hypothetical protein